LVEVELEIFADDDGDLQILWVEVSELPISIRTCFEIVIATPTFLGETQTHLVDADRFDKFR